MEHLNKESKEGKGREEESTTTLKLKIWKEHVTDGQALRRKAESTNDRTSSKERV